MKCNNCIISNKVGLYIDFNMLEEELASGIEESLDPALENIARYIVAIFLADRGHCIQFR